MHCSFEFVAGSVSIVKHLMEDIPLMSNKRFNLSIPAPHWEESPSINTYHCLDHKLLDSYFRLHRRRAGRGYRGYRGSVLATPPNTHRAPVCMISACTPFLVELCHRKHDKLVLAVSFNLCVFNDQGLLTSSPSLARSVGMDVLLQRRAINHLIKMRAKQLPMSMAFGDLAGAWESTISD